MLLTWLNVPQETEVGNSETWVDTPWHGLIHTQLRQRVYTAKQSCSLSLKVLNSVMVWSRLGKHFHAIAVRNVILMDDSLLLRWRTGVIVSPGSSRRYKKIGLWKREPQTERAERHSRYNDINIDTAGATVFLKKTKLYLHPGILHCTASLSEALCGAEKQNINGIDRWKATVMSIYSEAGLWHNLSSIWMSPLKAPSWIPSFFFNLTLCFSFTSLPVNMKIFFK